MPNPQENITATCLKQGNPGGGLFKRPNTKIVVCNKCLRASCVQDINPCEEHKKNRASIRLITLGQLEKMNLESPGFWAITEKGWRKSPGYMGDVNGLGCDPDTI